MTIEDYNGTLKLFVALKTLAVALIERTGWDNII